MSRDPLVSHGVLLLLVDGPEDVAAARRAAAEAAQVGTRVLAAVVLPPIGPTGDLAAVEALVAVRRQEAAAVSARVHPVVASYGVPLTAVPLLLPSGTSTWSRWRLRRALRLLVARSGAELLVVPPRDVLGLRPQAVAGLVDGGFVADPGVALVRPRVLPW